MNNLKELLKEGYPLREEKPKLPYKIYCDMDGVLTDFESRFEHYTGMHPQAYEKAKGLAAFWHLIDVEVGVKFWVGMPWMPQGERLWNFINLHHHLEIIIPDLEKTYGLKIILIRSQK